MKQTDVTYGQLDKALLSPGFSCQPTKHHPPGRFYEHKETGAVAMLPTYPDGDKAFEHHLLAVRTELDNFGLADPSVFAAELQKRGEPTVRGD